MYFDVKPSTITEGESATLRFYIRKPRKVRFTPETPELSKYNMDSDTLLFSQGSVLVQPKETTTYSVSAVVDRSGVLKDDSRQVTVTVLPDLSSLPGLRCVASNNVIDTLQTRSGSLTVSVRVQCGGGKSADTWSMTAAYKAYKGRSQQTTYEADGLAEKRAMQAIVSSGKLPSPLVTVLLNEVTPILASEDDSKSAEAKMQDSIRRGLAGGKSTIF